MRSRPLGEQPPLRRPSQAARDATQATRGRSSQKAAARFDWNHFAVRTAGALLMAGIELLEQEAALALMALRLLDMVATPASAAE